MNHILDTSVARLDNVKRLTSVGDTAAMAVQEIQPLFSDVHLSHTIYSGHRPTGIFVECGL